MFLLIFVVINISQKSVKGAGEREQWLRALLVPAVLAPGLDSQHPHGPHIK